MAERDQQPDFVKAKQIAFHFLKVRNRSEKELRQKFLQKKVSENIAEQTVDYLKNLKLIDDRQFAKEWIQMRLNKPYGLKRIFFELRQKGIHENIIKEQTGNLTNYNEVQMIKDLANKRMKRYPTLDPYKAKRRLLEYLGRRGFNLETIKEALNRL